MKFGQLKKILNKYHGWQINRFKKFIANTKDNETLSLGSEIELANLLSQRNQDTPLAREIKTLFLNHSILNQSITLDQQTLDQLINKCKDNLHSMKNITPQLQEMDLLNDINFHKLINLPSAYHERLRLIISNLKKQNLLTNDNLDKVFTLLSNKIPKPDKERCLIHNQSDWTEFKLTNGPLRLYVKNNTYFGEANSDEERISGGQGTVMKAKTTRTIKNPEYLIKCMHEPDEDVAKKETKYARFLGRDAHFFNNYNKSYFIGEWQPGMALDIFPSEELKGLTIKMRLNSLTYSLRDLSHLHQQYRVHGDIKFENSIFDKYSGQLNLIDFGSTRKVKPKNNRIPYTPDYLDSQIKDFDDITNNYSFCDDMYSFGLVVAGMFPDIYKVDLDNERTKTVLLKTTLTVSEKAVTYLVNTLLNHRRQDRCTSFEALDYCESIVNQFDTLKESTVNDILARTLHKKDCSYEDVIYKRTMLVG